MKPFNYAKIRYICFQYLANYYDEPKRTYWHKAIIEMFPHNKKAYEESKKITDDLHKSIGYPLKETFLLNESIDNKEIINLAYFYDDKLMKRLIEKLL